MQSPLSPAPPPPSTSPFGSATGAALDVVVVVPTAPSSPRRRSSRGQCPHCQDAPSRDRGVVASSDFFVSFPSAMAWARGEVPSSATSFRKTLSTKSSSLRSLFYSKSNVSSEGGRSSRESSVGGVIKEEVFLEDEGGTFGDANMDANISTHSTLSEMGTSATEAHHAQPQGQAQRPSTGLQSDYGDVNLRSQRLQSQNHSEFTQNRQIGAHRQGNVQIQLNGRYVPQLDMIFSSKRSNASSSFLLGSVSSNGGDDEPSCRFVNGNGLRPSTQTLSKLVQNSTGESEDSLDHQMGPTCTCHESIRNSPHHLCDQQRKSDRGPVLSYGRNLLRYTLFSTKGEVVATAEAHLYLWRSSDSVIVSDVDGTVTKSDVRGVIDTVIQDNFSYCHAGICKFFQDILDRGREEECIEEGEEVTFENGTIQHQSANLQPMGKGSESGEIRFLFLSSRPISLIEQTRKLLVSLMQTCPANRRYRLPPGPILCHTGPLSSVLFSELVAKNIHEFKADVLARQVVLPFVAARGEECFKRRNSSASCVCGVSPGGTTNVKEDSGRSWSGLSEASSMWDDRLFLAGFGNKVTDAMAYEMAGLDRRDIYIIDKESRILCMGADEDSERIDDFNRGMSESTNPNTSVANNNACAVDACAVVCDQEGWPLPDSCCSGQRESPATVRFTPSTKTEASASTIHSIEMSVTEGQQQETSEGVSVSQTSVDIVAAHESRNLAKVPSKSSRMKQSIRAFSSKKSFSTKFPSFRSVSSGGSKPPRKLYEGYGDPLLLARVRERMFGWNNSMQY